MREWGRRRSTRASACHPLCAWAFSRLAPDERDKLLAPPPPDAGHHGDALLCLVPPLPPEPSRRAPRPISWATRRTVPSQGSWGAPRLVRARARSAPPCGRHARALAGPRGGGPRPPGRRRRRPRAALVHDRHSPPPGAPGAAHARRRRLPPPALPGLRPRRRAHRGPHEARDRGGCRRPWGPHRRLRAPLGGRGVRASHGCCQRTPRHGPQRLPASPSARARALAPRPGASWLAPAPVPPRPPRLPPSTLDPCQPEMVRLLERSAYAAAQGVQRRRAPGCAGGAALGTAAGRAVSPRRPPAWRPLAWAPGAGAQGEGGGWGAVPVGLPPDA